MARDSKQFGRLHYWAYCWYKTLTLPRHIKRALREPVDPSEFSEIQRPELNDERRPSDG